MASITVKVASGVLVLGCVAGIHAYSEPPKDPPPGASPPPAAKLPIAEEKSKVQPKPLSEPIKKGLDFLAKSQNEDGGWGQGGGWRTANEGQKGRVEGNNVADPSDVGNTCIALLAFVRAGNTPTQGDYKEHVRKGLAFMLERIEKSDSESLYVTDVRNTQLQSKIGPYVDTFLSNLVMAELKGQAGPLENRLAKALDKTVQKIVKHQGKDGQFAGNGGWAPVLSQGIANKALSRSRQAGVQLPQSALDRAAAQSEAALAGPAPATPAEPGKAPASGPADSLRGDIALGVRGGAAGGDAGVQLYRISQGAGNTSDVANALKPEAEKAKEILKDEKASPEAKKTAQETVDRFNKLEESNTRALNELGKQIRSERFVAGFGSNGGEEFLSFLNISEALVVKGGKDWDEWDGKMQEVIPRSQDKNGSWSGQHCITGRTFCTASALLVLMGDRTPCPVPEPKNPQSGEPAPKK